MIYCFVNSLWLEKFGIIHWEINYVRSKCKKKIKSLTKLWLRNLVKTNVIAQSYSNTQANTRGHVRGKATLRWASKRGVTPGGSTLLPPCCSALTNLEIPALLPSVCTAEIQRPRADSTHGIRSSWIYILYSLGVMNLTLLDLSYLAHPLSLLYETLQLLPSRAEAELFESGKLFSYHISSKSTGAFNSQFYHRNKSIWRG